MKQRITLFVILLFLPYFTHTTGSAVGDGMYVPLLAADADRGIDRLFSEMQLEGIVNREAFRKAVEGYRRIERRKREVLTLIDFSLPSTDQRFYVFDMEAHRLLFRSVVSHGRGSGENYATSFSNEAGSHKSSPGFYLTENTYQGRNGYSLILDGLEKGVNDHARERAIVVHGADYAHPDVARSAGRLGRSHGCPALPKSITRPVIDAIKGGSVLYIYVP